MYPFFRALITLLDISPTFKGERLNYLLFVGGVCKWKPSHLAVWKEYCTGHSQGRMIILQNAKSSVTTARYRKNSCMKIPGSYF